MIIYSAVFDDFTIHAMDGYGIPEKCLFEQLENS